MQRFVGSNKSIFTIRRNKDFTVYAAFIIKPEITATRITNKSFFVVLSSWIILSFSALFTDIY